ncbi:MAG TPA: DoxX family protein [Rubrobacter sp.]|nr:DoxX family protein [Rubrobacter sp.]
MNTLLWAAQVALAVTFLAHGLLFLFPLEAVRKIKRQSPLPEGFMRFVYVAEVLAAFGLTLPALTGLFPWLTVLAAAGLASIMVGAAALHLSRRETSSTVVTTMLLALAVLVTYSRLFVVPL